MWCLVLVLLWPRAVQAQESLASDVRSYDLESRLWAVIIALMGGALGTHFTLATDATLIVSYTREILKDAVVAMIAGALAYIALQALNSFTFIHIPSEARFAVIVFAGWSRLAFFGWLNKFGTRVTETVEQRVINALNSGSLPTTQTPPDKPRPFKELYE